MNGVLKTEAQTRLEVIDDQLARAGWFVDTQGVSREFVLRDGSQSGGPRQTGDDVADYVLKDEDERPLAIVEAKRTSRDSLSGQIQASDYATRIEEQQGVRPITFLANGEYIWIEERGRFPLRPIVGFLSREDLKNRLFQQQYSLPLHTLAPDTNIIERGYQHEAVRRVTEALSNGQRKFLLVMATGTGKTRTVIALVDVLLRAKWARRVLFLVDRRELAKQAMGDFKTYLPHEARVRVEGGLIDDDARIHVATYPGMMQAYEKLSHGYYDLIIADESHRSIYNRYRTLFSHFDALQIGLTATPTDYIDHNTFDLFECPDGLPTFYYPYDTAVEEGHLVNYRVLEAQTAFQLQGIKAGQLPDEMQRQMEDQGIELSEVNFEGTDLERRISNSGTNDAIVEEFMAKARRNTDGTLPAKSIIFAMSQAHAKEIWLSFNRRYPDLQRRGFAELVHSGIDRVEQRIEDFKWKEMPRVAISVDMLDAGVDVPAIQTLVFAKPIFSQVKFWQMIGRGTRLWKDPQSGNLKKDFLIIDHWNNFSYFNLHPQGEIAHMGEALPVRLFRLLLEKLLLLRGQDTRVARETSTHTITQLQLLCARLPTDNINVRPHKTALIELAQAQVWQDLREEYVQHLSSTIAPLLRFLPDINPSVMGFETRCVELTVARLLGHVERVAALRARICDDIRQLPLGLPEVVASSERIAWWLSDGFWKHLSLERIEELGRVGAPLMSLRGTQRNDIIRLNLPDHIASRRWIIYGPTGEGAFADSYREQVESTVRNLAQHSPALRKLQKGESISDDDLHELEMLLNQSDLFITETVLRDVYENHQADLCGLLRHVLGATPLRSHKEEVTVAFDNFIAAHPHFTATQINFLRAVRSALLRGSKLSASDLEGPPFSRVGEVHRLFDAPQFTQIVELAQRWAA